MRAIILAAGRGSRLGHHTSESPKCLVQLAGRSLLAYQLEAIREVTDDIVIVRGYAGAQIDEKYVRYVDNADFASRNSVDSLMKAREFFSGPCLVCYSDLVYEVRILKSLAASKVSIGVAVDTHYEDYWRARWGDLSSDSESLTIGAAGEIRELGRPAPEIRSISGRFVGLMRFDASGAESFKASYDHHGRVSAGSSEPWQRAPSFHTAAMTDMLQALIDQGLVVSAVSVSGGWVEVDTIEDHRRCQEWIDTGAMPRFCTAFCGEPRGAL